MANTVNGVAAITAKEERETTGIQPTNFIHAHQGEVLRARVNYDTSLGTAYTIDDPTVDVTPSSGCRLFLVGIGYSDADAGTLTIYSKVGASSAVQLEEFALSANAGILVPTKCDQIVTVTDQGGALQIACDVALELTLYYIIADSCNL